MYEAECRAAQVNAEVYARASSEIGIKALEELPMRDDQFSYLKYYEESEALQARSYRRSADENAQGLVTAMDANSEGYLAYESLYSEYQTVTAREEFQHTQ